MKKKNNTGRDPSEKELKEAERIQSLPEDVRRSHPTAVESDPTKLTHINTYGSLPDYYIDRVFTCRKCGKREIWRARDQKWYYEETKAHIDAVAVECHDCRTIEKE